MIRARLATTRFLPLVLVVGTTLGCGSDSRLAPLSVGQKWDYKFQFGLHVESGQIVVAREVPVAGGVGWELKGPMGVSRVGYDGDRLVADQLAGAFLRPPLPIGVPLKDKVPVWKGWVQSAGAPKPAKATITASETRIEIGSRRRSANKTVVRMWIDGKAIELATYYIPGSGIVSQDQHDSQDRLNISLSRVAL